MCCASTPRGIHFQHCPVWCVTPVCVLTVLPSPVHSVYVSAVSLRWSSPNRVFITTFGCCLSARALPGMLPYFKAKNRMQTPLKYLGGAGGLCSRLPSPRSRCHPTAPWGPDKVGKCLPLCHAGKSAWLWARRSHQGRWDSLCWEAAGTSASCRAACAENIRDGHRTPGCSLAVPWQHSSGIVVGVLCCCHFKGSALAEVGSGARTGCPAPLWAGLRQSVGDRCPQSSAGPSAGAEGGTAISPQAVPPLPWCKALPAQRACRCQPVPRCPRPLLAAGLSRGCRCSPGQVQGTMARPLPQQQDGWQQPCQGSHSQVALPAVLGAAVSMAGPAPSPCSKRGWGGCRNHGRIRSAGCLSCWWAAPEEPRHPRSWNLAVEPEDGACAQAAPRCWCAPGPVPLPGSGHGCPVLLLPAGASAGGTSTGRGSGCLRRAQSQRFPGWQAQRRARSHPPATSPTEASPSPARIAASSLEPARLRSRLLLRQRGGLHPRSPPQPGGASPGRSPSRCHPSWPRWLQRGNRVQMWRQRQAPAWG